MTVKKMKTKGKGVRKVEGTGSPHSGTETWIPPFLATLVELDGFMKPGNRPPHNAA